MSDLQLSIIVPVYNVENYITECINSIMGIPKSVSTECIFVDDCGCDKSMYVINKVLSEYSGSIIFKIIRHKNNKGLSAARNSGLKIAQGEYVFFFDSDDHINSEGLARLVKDAIISKADIVVGSYIEYLDGTDINKGEIHNLEADKDIKYRGEDFFVRFHRTLTSVVWRNIYKRDFLLKNNIKFHEGVYFEDLEFTPIVFCKAKSVVYSDVLFYYYRRRINSITTSNSSEKKVIDLILIWSELDRLSRSISNTQIKAIFTEIGGISFLHQYRKLGKPINDEYYSMIRTFNITNLKSTKYKIILYLFKVLPQNIIIKILSFKFKELKEA